MKWGKRMTAIICAGMAMSGCTESFWRETTPPGGIAELIREEEERQAEEPSISVSLPQNSNSEVSEESEISQQTQEESLSVSARQESLYSYDRMMEELRQLEKTYPQWIDLDSIGNSVQGREIPLVLLGNGSQEVLYIAAIHGCEFSTVNYIMRCLREYAQAADQGEDYGSYDIAGILSKYTLYIVPMANPDGFEISNQQAEPDFICEELEAVRAEYSTNANGVNLNRNFPFEWEKALGSDQHEYSAAKGTEPGSEPETKALMALCKERDFIQMFSFHNYGYCIYWRDEINGEIEGDERLLGLLWANCGFYGQDVTSEPDGYAGGFENWFRSQFSKPGLCIELGLTQYAPSEYMEQFETAIAWEQTRLCMLQGLSE